jgi:hypothetical protein
VYEPPSELEYIIYNLLRQSEVQKYEVYLNLLLEWLVDIVI